jgi:hypothetical protein
LIERKPTKKASIFLVFRKMIKRIKRLINALNFVLIHQRTNTSDMTNICTQIKHFVCDICDMMIEKFL